MCSIYGAIGWPEPGMLSRLKRNAGDRGRDGGDYAVYYPGEFAPRGRVPRGKQIILGNWRAIPTTEVERAPYQPYHGVVHNGMIANDKELGARPGEVDSMVLPRVLDRSHGLKNFRDSLLRIKGSYAIGALAGQYTERIYLATNYKPIHYWSPDGITFYFSSMRRHFQGVARYGQEPARVEPYTAMDLESGLLARIGREDSDDALVIASGGLDSSTVAAMFKAGNPGRRVRMLYINYGQRASEREERAVLEFARAIGVEADTLDIDYTQLSGGSALLDPDKEISGGVAGTEYAHEWVPARNLVMLSLAAAYAEANGFHIIALGNNLEEAGAYPDNEEDFTERFSDLLPNAVHDGYALRVESPVGHLMKHEIVKKGLELDVPYELTWSCYRGEDLHCGRCGPCFMRRTAFERSGSYDPAQLHMSHDPARAKEVEDV